LEYIPFGEVFIDERAATSTWSTPYKFNAKELDEETGLYYYGARYYDPRTSVWISKDPLAEKYPNVGSYVYCVNNPVKFIDPDGRQLRSSQGVINQLNAISKLSMFEIAWKNSRHGDYTTEEWQFSVSLSNDRKSIIGRNLYTDHLDGGIDKIQDNVPLTEQLVGYVHTHQYSIFQGSEFGVTFSAEDISLLRDYSNPDISILRGYSASENFFMIVEAGTKRYALVITDSEKARLFFKQNSKDKIIEKYNAIYKNKNSKLSMQQRAEAAVKATIGDSNKSGISLYVTKDKNKEKFEKL